MTDYRSKAELFVTEFLDYINKHDILDHFDKKTQKMIRSAGVEALIRQASDVFPPRVAIGKAETDKLTSEQVSNSIEESENVLDRRDAFSRKIQTNGGAKGLLERILEGDVTAIPLARELIDADNGDKEFYVSPKV
jgi:hypothetical protein